MRRSENCFDAAIECHRYTKRNGGRYSGYEAQERKLHAVERVQQQSAARTALERDLRERTKKIIRRRNPHRMRDVRSDDPHQHGSCDGDTAHQAPGIAAAIVGVCLHWLDKVARGRIEVMGLLSSGVRRLYASDTLLFQAAIAALRPKMHSNIS
jgi:hypothetical protein